MYRLVESICILDGEALHQAYHQDRVERSWRALFGSSAFPLLEEVIQIPNEWRQGLVKCRIIYSPGVMEINYSLYAYRQISAVKLVYTTGIEYAWKFEERSQLDVLYEKRGTSDEIFIVRDGLITDAYYYNIAAKIQGRWYTPAVPLLKGTCRQRLLDEGYLEEAQISVEDIPLVQEWHLINAMTPPGTIVILPGQLY